jgi:hypothetical protein
MTNPYPGQVVYRSYSPQRVGVITEVIERVMYTAGRYAGEATGEYKVRIAWANKKREMTVESTWGLADYENLVIVTENKARSHRQVLDRVRRGELAQEPKEFVKRPPRPAPRTFTLQRLR